MAPNSRNAPTEKGNKEYVFKQKRVKAFFILSTLVIFVTLNIFVGVFLVNWKSITSLIQFAIFQMLNLGVAYGLTEFVISQIIIPKELSTLSKITKFPKVALLYVTCDDVLPEAIERLKNQEYPNYDIFVLDDSKDDKNKNIIDAFGYCVVRRNSSYGFKAGNLNNWINKWGKTYPYFVILDSDSIIPDDFITTLIKYAMHPGNKDVAIFQSKIDVWNQDNHFVKTLSKLTPLWVFPTIRLGNTCDTILSWGHNNLCRTKHLIDIGGFDEKFIAEDYATSTKLIQKGYKIRFVNYLSYEAFPPTPKVYLSRSRRWAKQNIQLLQLDIDRIPLMTKLHLLLNIWSYIIWAAYIPGIFLVVYGSVSSWNDVTLLSSLIKSGEFIHTPLLYPIIMIVFYNFYFLFLQWPLALRLGITSRDYWVGLILVVTLGIYISLPIAYEVIQSLVSPNRVKFSVTTKNTTPNDSKNLFMEFWFLLLLVLLVLMGVIRNPVALLFNFPWMLPLLLSPAIMWYIQSGKGQADIR